MSDPMQDLETGAVALLREFQRLRDENAKLRVAVGAAKDLLEAGLQETDGWARAAIALVKAIDALEIQ